MCESEKKKLSITTAVASNKEERGWMDKCPPHCGRACISERDVDGCVKVEGGWTHNRWAGAVSTVLTVHTTRDERCCICDVVPG